MFSDKKFLYLHFKNLQKIIDQYKRKEMEIQKEIEVVTKDLNIEKSLEKELKQLIYSLQNSIRALPPEKQIYLNRKETGN